MCIAVPIPTVIKWGALTRKYARHLFDGSTVENRTLNFMATKLARVTIVAGYYAGGTDEEEAKNALLEKADVRRPLMEVVRLAIQLNETVGQKFPLYPMVPVHIVPGSPFNPSTMNTEFDEDMTKIEAGGVRAVCTTALGLKRGIIDGTDFIMLLKPKVATDVDKGNTENVEGIQEAR